MLRQIGIRATVGSHTTAQRVQLIREGKLDMVGMTRALIEGAPGKDLHESLTRRELEVLIQLGTGRTAKQIASNLRISPKTIAVHKFMKAYPQLVYGDAWRPYVDLFNHGAHGGLWYGEDYAFSRNWIDAGGDIWIVPDLNIDHHSADKVFKGNFHKYLLALPPVIKKAA